MPRQLSTVIRNEIRADTNESTHLIQLNYWTGSQELSVFFTTASQDIRTTGIDSVPNVTWIALGFGGGDSGLSLSDAQETANTGGQSMRLQLDGVDQSIISIIMNNHFRGRLARIFRCWLDRATGEVLDAIETWRGLQNDSWEIETSDDSDSGIGSEKTVTISTSVVSFLAIMQNSVPVMTNVISHNAMLARGSQATGDTGFQTVPTISGRDIYWGRSEPERISRPKSGSQPGWDPPTGRPGNTEFRGWR